MRDSGEPDWKCGEVAGQFELKGAYLDGPIAKLSGGWQTRVKLAALLLHEPNLLLLDEPTNFLDLRTQILLEHFLQSHRSACLIVSHDRAFLGATCSHTLDLTRGKLTMFPGKVDCVSRISKREAAARGTRQRKRFSPSAGTWKSSSPRTRPAPLPRRSPARRASSSNAWNSTRSLRATPTARIRAPRVEPRKGAGVRAACSSSGRASRLAARALFLAMNSSRLPALGENRFVGAFLVQPLLFLKFEKRIHLAWEHRQFAAGQVEGMAARGAEKGPVVRHDQARRAVALQKMFQKNLGAQIEKVRRLVEQQKVRLVQQEGRQLHARLPAAGELRDRAVEIGPLSSNCPATSPHFQSGSPLSRIRNSRAVSSGRNGSCWRK